MSFFGRDDTRAGRCGATERSSLEDSQTGARRQGPIVGATHDYATTMPKAPGRALHMLFVYTVIEVRRLSERRVTSSRILEGGRSAGRRRRIENAV